MRQQLLDDLQEARRQIGLNFAERHGPAADPFAETLDGAVAGIRETAGYHVVYRAAEAEEVAPPVDVATTGLLGRHVVDRADRDPIGRRKRGRLVGLHQDAESQVEDLDPAVVGQEQVRGA